MTLYFFRQNLRGIHESSDKAMKIMWATTIMAVILIGWCVASLIWPGPAQGVPWQPDLSQKVEYVEEKPDANKHETLPHFRQRLQDQYHYDASRLTDLELEGGVNVPDPERPGRLLPKTEDGKPVLKNNESVSEFNTLFGTNHFKPDDPLGFLGQYPAFGFLRIVGVLGLFLAFGHSILAMSGEETLAQVYREVEAPKLPNFKKAAFIVFVYSMLLTAGISFLAVMLIPDEVRMKFYSGNLIGGLARHVIGPDWLKLVLEPFVVGVGFLILAGAVNTAIIGSNGVLNRIAEDGVLPDWFLKPHPQIRHDLPPADPHHLPADVRDRRQHGPRHHPGRGLRLRRRLELRLQGAVDGGAALHPPREAGIHGAAQHQGRQRLRADRAVADLPGAADHGDPQLLHQGGGDHRRHGLHPGLRDGVHRLRALHEKRRAAGKQHQQHMEQFNRATTEEVTPASLGVSKPYRKLVSIRSTHNLFMLEKALNETDPETTNVVVMTAKLAPVGEIAPAEQGELDAYDQKLMTAVVDRAEKAGKQVKPLIVPTNNPLHAVLKTAMDLQAQELILGASNKYTVDEQLEQIAFYWINLHGGIARPADRAASSAANATSTSTSAAAAASRRSASATPARWPSCGRPARASTACCCCTTAAAPTATCSRPS